jgi:hypothetical protein
VIVLLIVLLVLCIRLSSKITWKFRHNKYNNFLAFFIGLAYNNSLNFCLLAYLKGSHTSFFFHFSFFIFHFSISTCFFNSMIPCIKEAPMVSYEESCIKFHQTIVLYKSHPYCNLKISLVSWSACYSVRK